MVAILFAAAIATTTPEKPTNDIMENLRASARNCYQIGEGVQRLKDAGMDKELGPAAAIADGRKACFMPVEK